MVKLEIPDSQVHGANMRPIWVLPASDGPHVDPMNLAIRGTIIFRLKVVYYIMAGHAIVVAKGITLLFHHGNAVILTLW